MNTNDGWFVLAISVIIIWAVLIFNIADNRDKKLEKVKEQNIEFCKGLKDSKDQVNCLVRIVMENN